MLKPVQRNELSHGLREEIDETEIGSDYKVIESSLDLCKCIILEFYVSCSRTYNDKDAYVGLKNCYLNLFT